MRVPPDQSAHARRAGAPAPRRDRAPAARASHWSAACRTGTIVTRLRASVTAWRKCRNSRVYWLIEPEISSSATIGGGLSILPGRDISDRSARRRPSCWRAACGACRCDGRARSRRESGASAPRSSGSAMLRDRVLGLRDLGRAHLREVLLLQHLAVGHREPRVEFDCSCFLRLSVVLRAANSASCTRCDAGGGFFLAWSGSGDQHRSMLLRYSRAARKNSRTPGRTASNARAASRTPHAASSRNRRACRCSISLQRVQRIEHRARPDRNAGGAQRARKVDDVVGDLAGRASR